MVKKFLFAGFIAICLLQGSNLSSSSVSALSGSQFQAGKIITDGRFYTSDTMSTSQVQAFLDSKVPSCDTDGSETYSGSTSRAEYGTSKGYPPPYTCIKDYSQTTPSKNADSYCGSYTGGTKSAAKIISDVAKSCDISEKVLIVLLQKEQSLITDEWPWSIQYKKATGYACPDTGRCDSQFYGFFNQVYNAAKQFNRYKINYENYNHIPNRTNSVRFNPKSSCGSKSVFISGYATSSLYNYTPYTPNKAALNDLYGNGDLANPDPPNCSSFGNRNFWRMYYEWFGNPLAPIYDSERIKGPGSSSDTTPIGGTKTVSLQFKNIGEKPLYDSASITGSRRPTYLRATHINDSESAFNGAFSTDTVASKTFTTVYDAEGNPKTTNQHIAQPGQTVKVSFKVKSPSNLSPGQYRLKYQLVIPANGSKSRINVGPSDTFYLNLKRLYASSDVSSSNTLAVPSGSSREATIKIKNTGYKTWYTYSNSAGMDPIVLVGTHINGHLSAFNGSFDTPTRASQAINKVYASDGSIKGSTDTVAPDETAEFKVDVESPDFDYGGYFRLKYQLVIPATSNSSRVNIGKSNILSIEVPAPYSSLRIKGVGASSASIKKNTEKTVSIKFKNTGTKTWYDAVGSSTSPVILMATHVNGKHSAFNGSFTTATRPTENFSSVFDTNGNLKASNTHIALPGETVKLTFKIKVPSGVGPGEYRLKYQLVIPATASISRINVNEPEIYYITVTNT